MRAEYVKAVLRGRSYAVPTGVLAAVLDGARVTPVPFAESDVLGITRYGGAMIAVVDPFGDKASPARLALVTSAEGRYTAYLADDARDIITLGDDEVEKLGKEGRAKGPVWL